MLTRTREIGYDYWRAEINRYRVHQPGHPFLLTLWEPHVAIEPSSLWVRV